MCHLVDLAEHLTQRFRGADYVLKHLVTIDLLSQRDSFVSQAVFGSFTVLDVRPCCIPTNDLSALVQQRVVPDQEPPILTGPSQRPLLVLELSGTGDAFVPFLAKTPNLIGMAHA